MIKKDRVKCPICKKDVPIKINTIIKLRHAKRVQCPKCECMFFDDNNYPHPIYDFKYNMEFFRPTDIRKEGIMACKISTLLGPPNKATKILEIGSGNGLFTALMQVMQYEIMAVDIDPVLCEMNEKTLNIRTKAGEFEQLEFKDKFSFIYAAHVLEHTKDPIHFVNKAREILGPNGILYLTMPDLTFQKKHGLNWKHFQTRNLYEHNHLFSPKTLKCLAAKTSFSIMNIDQNQHFSSMEAMLRKTLK